MANLSTRFFGLELKTPVIIGSSGLSNTVEKIKLLAQNGAGAVVLKSIFEEEIYSEYKYEFNKQAEVNDNLEYLDYFDYEIKSERIIEYLNLIEGVKNEKIDIPLIASINCTSGNDWVFFAQKLAQAGANALELNLYIIPSDVNRSAEKVREYYFATIKKVLDTVDIPVTVKLSSYFSDLAAMIKELSETGIAGITLFNRFYNIDIDIEKRQLMPAKVLSHPFEYQKSLRWIGIMSGRVKCDLAASSGVHDYHTAIKMLMAGANAIQIVSGIYKHGYNFVKEMVEGLNKWMDDHDVKSIDEIIGVADLQHAKNPAQYERVQFMRYFGEYDKDVD